MANGQSRKDADGQILPPSFRKNLRIGSWNVRTLYEAGKTAQTVQEMQKYRLDILGISETHWSQEGQKKLRDRERTGKTWSELAKVAQDRDKWRALVCGLYPDRGGGR